ncbi:MAG: glutaredoxin family protein [Ignavibacteria bacterium]|nr:glutaredoxin family protein [Ignavibacteria bacterium]
MKSVELLTKPDCHLCEVAREEILQFKNKFEFSLTEIDITTRQSLFEMFKEHIPVIFGDGVIISRIELNKEKLIEFLKV